ncbi:hypothetical protein C7M84_020682 [Penaeus vannamei]|uniref:Uncharacterized protein n=1 Tax=Penaeus vannamei TaxID=6689 RepID=A0A423SBG2_PENVA|nr:hypothetical protein C7M84_020682 [Penaeus vannamei]
MLSLVSFSFFLPLSFHSLFSSLFPLFLPLLYPFTLFLPFCLSPFPSSLHQALPARLSSLSFSPLSLSFSLLSSFCFFSPLLSLCSSFLFLLVLFFPLPPPPSLLPSSSFPPLLFPLSSLVLSFLSSSPFLPSFPLLSFLFRPLSSSFSPLSLLLPSLPFFLLLSPLLFDSSRGASSLLPSPPSHHPPLPPSLLPLPHPTNTITTHTLHTSSGSAPEGKLVWDDRCLPFLFPSPPSLSPPPFLPPSHSPSPSSLLFYRPPSLSSLFFRRPPSLSLLSLFSYSSFMPSLFFSFFLSSPFFLPPLFCSSLCHSLISPSLPPYSYSFSSPLFPLIYLHLLPLPLLYSSFHPIPYSSSPLLYSSLCLLPPLLSPFLSSLSPFPLPYPPISLSLPPSPLPPPPPPPVT